MASVKRKLKSTMVDIAGKNWADLCDSSQSSQSLTDTESPLKIDKDARAKDEDDELYDMVFQPIKKEPAKIASQDDLSLTSFMNNVHMVTPVKQETDTSPAIIDEDTICSPFTKHEPKAISAADTRKLEHKESVEENLKSDIQHVKRRLTSECNSMVSENEPSTPEQVKKVNKKSTEHRNIHDSVESPKTKLERETDALILARRQKQIDFGKNTIGYEKYLEQVPKHKRKKEHPKTPPKNLKYTRRAWDGLVKNWRVRLHCWDPDSKNDDDDVLTTGSSSNLYSLGSMTSLDSSSQASDSRPPTPPAIKGVEESSQENQKAVSSLDSVNSKKPKTQNK